MLRLLVVVGALIALLSADAAVAADAAGYMFGGEIPESVSPEMPRRAIVLAKSGGPSLTGASFSMADTQRVDLFAYGATPHEAEQLLTLAAFAFREARRQERGGVLIHWINPAGGQTGGRTSGLAWPRAFQSFQVFHALRMIA